MLQMKEATPGVTAGAMTDYNPDNTALCFMKCLYFKLSFSAFHHQPAVTNWHLENLLTSSLRVLLERIYGFSVSFNTVRITVFPCNHGVSVMEKNHLG